MIDGWLVIPDSGGAIIEERQRFVLIANGQQFKTTVDQQGNLWLSRDDELFYMVKFSRTPLLGLTVTAKSIDRDKQDVTCASADALLALGRRVSDEFRK